jgi:NitT/TauT family transport system substrate-binding protein
MADAVSKKQVDAADLSEPFLTSELAKGSRTIMSNGEGFAPDAAQAVWVTSAAFLANNRAIVDKFIRGIKKSSEYAGAHPDEVRQAITSYTQTTAEQADKILMPAFSPSMSRQSFQVYYDTMKELGVIKKDADLNSLFVE